MAASPRTPSQTTDPPSTTVGQETASWAKSVSRTRVRRLRKNTLSARLTLLHSFEYDEAVEGFREAQPRWTTSTSSSPKLRHQLARQSARPPTFRTRNCWRAVAQGRPTTRGDLAATKRALQLTPKRSAALPSAWLGRAAPAGDVHAAAEMMPPNCARTGIKPTPRSRRSPKCERLRIALSAQRPPERLCG